MNQKIQELLSKGIAEVGLQVPEEQLDKLLAFQTLLQLKEEFPKALLIPVKDVKLENID